MHKADNKPRSFFHHAKRITFHGGITMLGIVSLLCIIGVSYLFFLDKTYSTTTYPRVFIGDLDVSGKTQEEIISLWEQKNTPYRNVSFEFVLDSTVATISGSQLRMGYDSSLLAKQAYLIGRSGKPFSDIYTKLFKRKTTISPYFRWDTAALNEFLSPFADEVYVAPQDALFEFNEGKVTMFKPGLPGKKLNKTMVEAQVESVVQQIPYSMASVYTIPLTVDIIKPALTTDQVNTYGIKERIGVGYSVFTGSIPGRIHNVNHAAKKFHGVLIPPGEIVSYNKIIGDISAATGYQPAYIIKDGRTVLGDGGGVCQVSTTLFRAALNAGLPIVERQPHAYRVHYYEDGGFKPGLDATVFAPSVDLKFKNDTPGHILIQSKIDMEKLSLEIELFGTSDGRKAEILNHQILSQSPPPPPLYQDDPTLRKGITKQVDWSAWGARTIFTYKVTRDGQSLIDQQFVSNYRPWQAVYLVGTM